MTTPPGLIRKPTYSAHQESVQDILDKYFRFEAQDLSAHLSSNSRESEEKRVLPVLKYPVFYKPYEQNLEMLRNFVIKTNVPNVLTVGCYANFAPVSSWRGSHPEGLDADILNALAKLLGLKIEFKAYSNWSKLLKACDIEEVDCAAGGIAMTLDRIHRLHKTEWTIPYFHVKRVAISRKASPVKRFPDDLRAGATVVATKDSTAWLDADYLRKKKGLDFKLQKGSENEEEDIELLLKGKVDCVLRGNISGHYLQDQNPNQLTLSYEWDMDPSILPDGEHLCFMCSERSRLSAALSFGIFTMSQIGILGKISNVWSREDSLFFQIPLVDKIFGCCYF